MPGKTAPESKDIPGAAQEMDALNAAFMQEGYAHKTSLDQDDILVLAIVLADDAAPLVMPWRQDPNDGLPAIDVCGEIGGKGSAIQKIVKSDGYSGERQRTGRREKAAGQRGSGSLKTADGGELHRKP